MDFTSLPTELLMNVLSFLSWYDLEALSLCPGTSWERVRRCASVVLKEKELDNKIFISYWLDTGKELSEDVLKTLSVDERRKYINLYDAMGGSPSS